MASYMILLGTPRELNIPYFALGTPGSGESRLTRLGSGSKPGKLLGRRSMAWVNAGKNQTKGTFVETRNCVPPKTAFYAEWLLFENDAAFQDFLQAFPQYCLNARLAKINEEREGLAADLQRRVERRDFDLSRIGDEQQRENLARRYVETRKKLSELQEQARLLDTANQLQREWEEKS